MLSEDAIPANTNRIWPISHRVAMWRHFGLDSSGYVRCVQLCVHVKGG